MTDLFAKTTIPPLPSLSDIAMQFHSKSESFRKMLQSGSHFCLTPNLRKQLKQKISNPEIILLSEFHAILKADNYYHCDHTCFAYAALSQDLYNALRTYQKLAFDLSGYYDPNWWKSIDESTSKIEKLKTVFSNKLEAEEAKKLLRFVLKSSFENSPIANFYQIEPHKGLNRTRKNGGAGDAFYPPIQTASGLIAASSGMIAKLVEPLSKHRGAISEIKYLIEQMSPADPPPNDSATGASNTIVFGPPGTGKSFEINRQFHKTNQIRTVFHSETQYSDFAGSLRPVMKSIISNSNLGAKVIGESKSPYLRKEDGSCTEQASSTQVAYEFRPGPFTRALIDALNKPLEPHVLVIEEINRASAAAAIGEIFQLLDRDESGRSAASIHLADPDMLSYIKEKLDYPEILDDGVYIPENLSLIATMNSGDQLVQPLDTAFKRRWTPEYFPIDFSKLEEAEGYSGDATKKIKVGTKTTITWAEFARQVNEELNGNVAEDRHLAPFFLTPAEFKSDEFNDIFFGKVLVYLWDDVLKYHESEREKIFDAEIKSIGELFQKYKNSSGGIYCEEFINKFKSPSSSE